MSFWFIIVVFDVVVIFQTSFSLSYLDSQFHNYFAQQNFFIFYFIWYCCFCISQTSVSSIFMLVFSLSTPFTAFLPFAFCCLYFSVMSLINSFGQNVGTFFICFIVFLLPLYCPACFLRLFNYSFSFYFFPLCFLFIYWSPKIITSNFSVVAKSYN